MQPEVKTFHRFACQRVWMHVRDEVNQGKETKNLLRRQGAQACRAAHLLQGNASNEGAYLSKEKCMQVWIIRDKFC